MFARRQDLVKVDGDAEADEEEAADAAAGPVWGRHGGRGDELLPEGLGAGGEEGGGGWGVDGGNGLVVGGCGSGEEGCDIGVNCGF